MPKLAITKHARIVRGGGPITSDVYKSNATSTWTAGALLRLSNGVLSPVVNTIGAGATINSTVTGTNQRLFLALNDHKTAGSKFVSVQEITRDTVLEIQLCASGSTNPTPANTQKGGSYGGYQLGPGPVNGNGIWGLDLDVTTNPVFNVIDVESNWNPFSNLGATDYAKVWVKVLGSILA